MSQTRTLIFTVPTTQGLLGHLWSNDKPITISALDPLSSRIEAVRNKNKLYWFCKSGKPIRKKTWNKLLEELTIEESALLHISKETWIDTIHNVYFNELKGTWNSHYFWEWGESTIRYSIRKLVDHRRISESAAIKEIIEQLDADNSIDWTQKDQYWPILTENVPKELLNRIEKIDGIVQFYKRNQEEARIKPSKIRMCLVINGPTSSGKSKLSELVLKRLCDKGIINEKHINLDEYRGVKLWDKVPSGFSHWEAIRWEEFGAEHFDFAEWTKLCLPTVSKMRIMRGFETTKNLKVSIFTTQKPPLSWIKDRSEDIEQLLQITKRAYFTINMYGRSQFSKTPTWEYVKDRAFLYGDVQHGMLETLIELNPKLQYELLRSSFSLTPLGNFIVELYKRFFNDLIQGKMFNGYIEDHQVYQPAEEFLYPADVLFPPKTILTFKWTKEWLKSKIITYSKGRFGITSNARPETLQALPKAEAKLQEIPSLVVINSSLTDFLKTNQEIYLDTETYSCKGNWISNLGLRTIQFGNEVGERHYLIWEELSDNDKDKYRALLIGKILFCFNLNFDASQLAHNGFKIKENTWYDVGTLARVTYNNLAVDSTDKGKKGALSLEMLAKNYLGLESKMDAIEALQDIYKIRKRSDVYSVKGLVHHEIFKKYALNDIDLTIKLHRHLKAESTNYKLWKDLLSRINFQQWANGFSGVKIDMVDINSRIMTLGRLREKLLAKLPDLTIGTKSKSQSKGWSGSPELAHKWLISNFDINLLEEHLKKSKKSGYFSFDREARAKLAWLFPDNNIIKVLSDLAKKEQIWEQLKAIRKNSSDDLLRYEYKLGGCKTGRYTSSAPAFHNFAKEAPEPEILILEEEKQLSLIALANRYCLRRLLIHELGVFSLDFKAQEDRMRAYLCEDPKEIQCFIEGRDPHQEEANQLGVTRNIGKRIRHGVSYGMGNQSLAEFLSRPIGEAKQLRDAFWVNHPELLAFKRKLDDAEGFKSPLLGRWVNFDKPHAKLNCVIQGSCVELLWVALDFLYKQPDKVKILPHFHDELVLKCLVCKNHTSELCKPILKLKAEIENLYPFVWPNTEIKVFELGGK